MMTIVWILVLAIVLSAAYAGLSAAPWLPTKPKQRRHLLESVKITDGVYYDLGAGDGSMLFALARKNTRALAVGYEISLLPYAVSLVRKWTGGSRYKNVSPKFGNLFKQDLSDADTVFVFLLEKSYPKLIKKFASELQDDARVIIEAWPMAGVKPEQTLNKEGLLPVFIYRGRSFRL